MAEDYDDIAAANRGVIQQAIHEDDRIGAALAPLRRQAAAEPQPLPGVAGTNPNIAPQAPQWEIAARDTAARRAEYVGRLINVAPWLRSMPEVAVGLVEEQDAPGTGGLENLLKGMEDSETYMRLRQQVSTSRSLPDDVQTKGWENLTRGQQAAFRNMGYLPPAERPEPETGLLERVGGGITGVPVLGDIAGFAGNTVRDLGTETWDALGTVGELPFQYYRAARIDLEEGLTLDFNPGHFMEMWRRGEDGENTFDAKKAALIEDRFDDPESYELTRRLLNEDVATVALDYGELNTPAYGKAFAELQDFAANPIVSQAMTDLTEARYDFGTDIAYALRSPARAIGVELTPGGAAFNTISVVSSIGLSFVADPFLILGKARTVINARRLSLLTGGDVVARVNSFFPEAIDALAAARRVTDPRLAGYERSLMRFNSQTREAMIVADHARLGLWSDLGHARPQQFRMLQTLQKVGIETPGDYQKFMASSVGLTALLDGRYANHMGKYLALPRLTRAGMVKVALKMDMRKAIDFADHAPVVLREALEAEDIVGGTASVWDKMRVGSTLSVANQAVRTLQLDHVAGAFKTLTRLLPEGDYIIFDHPDATRQLDRLLDFGVTGPLRDEIFDSFIAAGTGEGSEFAKRMLLHDVYETIFTNIGIRNDPKWAELVDAWIDRSRQGYASGDLDYTAIAGEVLPSAIWAIDDAHAAALPAFREIAAAVRRERATHWVTGIWDNTAVDKAMGVWRPWVILRPAFAIRAGGEEMLAQFLRFGLGHPIKQWAVLPLGGKDLTQPLWVTRGMRWTGKAIFENRIVQYGNTPIGALASTIHGGVIKSMDVVEGVTKPAVWALRRGARALVTDEDVRAYRDLRLLTAHRRDRLTAWSNLLGRDLEPRELRELADMSPVQAAFLKIGGDDVGIQGIMARDPSGKVYQLTQKTDDGEMATLDFVVDGNKHGDFAKDDSLFVPRYAVAVGRLVHDPAARSMIRTRTLRLSENRAGGIRASLPGGAPLAQDDSAFEAVRATREVMQTVKPSTMNEIEGYLSMRDIDPERAASHLARAVEMLPEGYARQVVASFGEPGRWNAHDIEALLIDPEDTRKWLSQNLGPAWTTTQAEVTRRNATIYYHGSREPLAGIHPNTIGASREGHLRGPGLYTTFHLPVSAGSYAGAEGSTVAIAWVGARQPRFLDLDLFEGMVELPDDVIKIMVTTEAASIAETSINQVLRRIGDVTVETTPEMERLQALHEALELSDTPTETLQLIYDNSDLIDTHVFNNPGEVSLMELAANVEHRLRTADDPGEVVAEMYRNRNWARDVNLRLKDELGYDAVRHVGGRASGRSLEHQVTVWLSGENLAFVPDAMEVVPSKVAGMAEVAGASYTSPLSISVLEGKYFERVYGEHVPGQERTYTDNLVDREVTANVKAFWGDDVPWLNEAGEYDKHKALVNADLLNQESMRLYAAAEELDAAGGGFEQSDHFRGLADTLTEQIMTIDPNGVEDYHGTIMGGDGIEEFWPAAYELDHLALNPSRGWRQTVEAKADVAKAREAIGKNIPWLKTRHAPGGDVEYVDIKWLLNEDNRAAAALQVRTAHDVAGLTPEAHRILDDVTWTLENKLGGGVGRPPHTRANRIVGGEAERLLTRIGEIREYRTALRAGETPTKPRTRRVNAWMEEFSGVRDEDGYQGLDAYFDLDATTDTAYDDLLDELEARITPEVETEMGDWITEQREWAQLFDKTQRGDIDASNRLEEMIGAQYMATPEVINRYRNLDRNMRGVVLEQMDASRAQAATALRDADVEDWTDPLWFDNEGKLTEQFFDDADIVLEGSVPTTPEETALLNALQAAKDLGPHGSGFTVEEAFRQNAVIGRKRQDQLFLSPDGDDLHEMLRPLSRGSFSYEKNLQTPNMERLPTVVNGPYLKPLEGSTLTERVLRHGFNLMGRQIAAIARRPLFHRMYAQGLRETEAVLGKTLRRGWGLDDEGVRVLYGKHVTVNGLSDAFWEASMSLAPEARALGLTDDGVRAAMRAAKVDEALVLDDFHVAKLGDWWKKEDQVRQELSRIAASRATYNIAPFIDDAGVRSQFSEHARNIFPFWFAQEQFYKRYARTFVSTPEGLQRLQLSHNALYGMGWIEKNEQGEEVFVYPGGAWMQQAVGRAAELLTRGKGSWTIPMLVPLTGQLRYAAPGLDATSGSFRDLLPQGGPVVATGLGALRWLNPTFGAEVEEKVLGPRGRGRDIFEMWLPTTLTRFSKAVTADPEAMAASTIGAIQLLAAADAKKINDAIAAGKDPEDVETFVPGEGATDVEIDIFINRVREWSRSLLYTKAILGAIGPASPIPDLDPDQLQGKFIELLRSGLTYEEAILQFVERNPDASAMTLFGSHAPSKAPLDPTTAAYEVMTTHSAFFREHKAAGWLLPSGRDSGFDQKAWNEFFATQLRIRRTDEEFYSELRFRQGAEIYYEEQRKKDEAKEYYKGNVQAQARIDAYWRDWSDTFKVDNPILAAGLNNESEILRGNQRWSLREALADPSAPESKQGPMLQTLLDEYQVLDDALGASLDSEIGKTARERARRKNMRNIFRAWAEPFVIQHPTVEVFYRRMIEPDIGQPPKEDEPIP